MKEAFLWAFKFIQLRPYVTTCGRLSRCFRREFHLELEMSWSFFLLRCCVKLCSKNKNREKAEYSAKDQFINTFPNFFAVRGAIHVITKLCKILGLWPSNEKLLFHRAKYELLITVSRCRCEAFSFPKDVRDARSSEMKVGLNWKWQFVAALEISFPLVGGPWKKSFSR